MNNFRRKADLRVSNIQQALQKATFGILKVCDKLVDQQPSTDKETLAANIDAIVLLGHALGELSRLRREQIKPALKPNFIRFAPRQMSRPVVPTCFLGPT